MPNLQENLSHATVEVPGAAVRRMLRLVKILDRLQRDPRYRAEIYPQVPESARFDPGHDAVMMCYDFHLAGDVPKLIEVNTNAGGALLAYLAHDPGLSIASESLSPVLKKRLLQTFADEIRQFSKGQLTRPQRLVIIDEHPEEQFLYPEMHAFVELFREWGADAEIADPQQLEASAEGVLLDDRPVDFIYNRHCDFYLVSEELAGVRDAYLSHRVCLSPNPHMYGLLADKRRMTLWSDPDWCGTFFSSRETGLLQSVVPQSKLLSTMAREDAWSIRKRAAFKPVDSFGSRGVLLGEKLSRKRFDQLPSETTLVQELVPPGMTMVDEVGEMKTDLRLYAYRDRAFGLTARLYRGQVTNMRTPGGGFARVKIV